VAASALVLLAAGLAARRGPRARDAAYAVAVMFLIQLGAGVVNLALLAPIWMQLVHLTLADLTWLALVRLAAVTLAEPAPQPALEAAQLA
jgi:heme a synthase